MESTRPKRKIATRTRAVSTETPVLSIDELADQIAQVQQTQESMLRVQNNHDSRLEELSLSTSSSTATIYPIYRTTPTYLASTIIIGKTTEHEIRGGASQLTQTMLFDTSYPEIRNAADEKPTPQATDGVPIENLLKAGGSLMFFISLSSAVIWLMGDVALIHPAASVIGLFVSPCLYLMGLAAQKQITS